VVMRVSIREYALFRLIRWERSSSEVMTISPSLEMRFAKDDFSRSNSVSESPAMSPRRSLNVTFVLTLFTF